jgi:NAD(P)-dependent dehydrogenase (short-subunit alcohol dehydrogenase family)
MGRATAARLGQSGFAIAAIDRDADGLQAMAMGLRAHGVPVLALPLDVTERAVVEQAFDEAAKLGPLHAVAAAAGILEGGFALEADREHFERVIQINVLGLIWTNVAAARAMIAAGTRGRIVNWSSLGAVGGAAGYSAYALSKAAVVSFTQSFALEVAPFGVTVNAILPGSVRTPMIGYVDETRTAQRLPLGRWADPDEIAALAAFLLSDDAEWITGVAWNADGGELAARGRVGRREDVEARLEAERDYRDDRH